MKIIVPTVITDAMLTSCTIAENDETEWNGGTPYSIGDRVMVAADHLLYEALTANSNSVPADNPTDWLCLGATNRWAMFDQKIGTVSTASETFTVELDVGIVTGVALLNTNALEVRITLTDTGEGVVFDQTYNLQDSSQIGNWYNYFYSEVRYRDSLIVEGLPSYRTATLTVTVTGASGGDVSVGTLVVGQLAEYAEAANYGASVGIQDYSVIDQDDFGNVYVVERAYSRLANFDVSIRTADLDSLVALLSSLRATPAVYIGASSFDCTVIYGFYRDFDVVISYPTVSELSIEIKGLV